VRACPRPARAIPPLGVGSSPHVQELKTIQAATSPRRHPPGHICPGEHPRERRRDRGGHATERRAHPRHRGRFGRRLHPVAVHRSSPIVTLGFRSQWQYPDRWLVKTCSRLGIEATLHETSGHVTALRTLRETLSKDGPRPLVWIDAQKIGYWHFPERFSGMGGYPVVVTGERDGRFFIDDRNSAPLSIDEETMRAARGRVTSYRNRLVTFEAPAEIPMRIVTEAIEAGLEDQVRHLGSDSDSFSLPAWRKWARMLTDTKHKKGWGNAFADQKGLFGVFLTIYESIESSGFGGGSLRGLYATFLDGLLIWSIDRP
jgi:Butirosin biosynthesis protein H, N-terminal